MRKSLQYLTKDQSGSLFVYLYFLLTFILIVIFSLFSRLEIEQNLARLEIEHLHLDMIHQQAYQTLLNDWDQIDQPTTQTYSFPNGFANIIINDEDQSLYRVTIRAFRESAHQKTKIYFIEKNQLD